MRPWRNHWLCALGAHRFRDLPRTARNVENGVVVRQCRRCYLNVHSLGHR